MEEELVGTIPIKQKDKNTETPEQVSDSQDSDLEEIVNLERVEVYDQDDHVSLIKSATNLIAAYAEKLGPAYEMNKSVAIYLLNSVVKSTSGQEALHKLEELIEMMELMLAEVNAISRWNERYPQGVSVKLEFDSNSGPFTIFDAREPSQIISDSSLDTISTNSSDVKMRLLGYMRDKFPEYLATETDSFSVFQQ